LAFPLLLVAAPWTPRELPRLIDWRTISALTGLLVLSRGLEDSGYLAWLGRKVLATTRGERALARVLVLFSAGLAAVVTNDVALFIVVPLTVSLRLVVTSVPVGRLVVFEALAVNAGSTLSPVGNPQNLFLWQSSGASFFEFVLTMLPLGIGLLFLLLAAIPLGFSSAPLEMEDGTSANELDLPLLRTSLALYPLFLIAIDLEFALPAAVLVVLGYLIRFRRVLFGVDWLLLGVFVLMFLDLGLLARWPPVAESFSSMEAGSAPIYTSAVLLSQVISNVPAAIFLRSFTENWQALAWGVSVGGFGLALGSLANLIALRLARQKGLWREFHVWSVGMLVVSYILGLSLL
jgi:Na+/H+ antiporter NhaD/arsenite permease-like protein